MSRERHMTAFYLETVLMVIIFVMVIAVLAQVFGQARLQSREAQRQTAAVSPVGATSSMRVASTEGMTRSQMVAINLMERPMMIISVEGRT